MDLEVSTSMMTTCKDSRTISHTHTCIQNHSKSSHKENSVQIRKRRLYIGEDQYGFRKGKSTRDVTGALRMHVDGKKSTVYVHEQNFYMYTYMLCRLQTSFR